MEIMHRRLLIGRIDVLIGCMGEWLFALTVFFIVNFDF